MTGRTTGRTTGRLTGWTTPSTSSVRRPARARGAAIVCAMSLATVTAGCAKDPTELLLTVSVDSTVTQQITSILVTVNGATGGTSHIFQSLAAPAADAFIPAFYFPTSLDLLITKDGVAGDAQIVVEASDPTISDTVLARGALAATITAAKTTTASVVLTAVPP